MTTLCPKCNVQINNEEFGLVNCHHCGEVLFLDIEGNIVINDNITQDEGDINNSALEKKSENTISKLSNILTGEVNGSDDSDTNEKSSLEDLTSEKLESISSEDINSDMNSTNINPDINSNFPPEPDSYDLDHHTNNSNCNKSNNYNNLSEEEAKVMLNEQTRQKDEDSLDISDFANSEISSGKEGALFFSVLISGIHTPEMKRNIKNILSDKRFLWDPNKILSNIDKGAILIKNINAVKATILINRLKSLSVNIIWEQHSINQI